MNPTPFFTRFGKHIIIGAVISGILSAMPVLNFINCCFCLLNMGGIILALSMYLNSQPTEKLSIGEAAGFGAAAGAGAGLIYSILNMFIGVLMTGLLAGLMGSILSNVPAQIRNQMMASSAMGMGMSLLFVPVNMVLYAAFGALGGVLGMVLFFKDRKQD